MAKQIKRILFIVTMISYFGGYAQNKISYYDAFQVVKTNDKDKAFTLLTALQKQDPDFANTYFQMGLIARDWAFDFNPFTDYTYTKLFIYNTKLYFNLAKLKLVDEKKKNIEFYDNADIKYEGKKPTVDDISVFIDKEVQEIDKYEKNITQIINFFNSCTDHYNECVNIYMMINSEYSKIKNIYLTEDSEFISKLEQLESHFDSTGYYFDKYKQAITKYPIKGYNQNYELRDIITYRLDGLTNSNFLNNNIVLWNYKKWVKNVFQMMKETISDNRKLMTEQDNKIKNQINQLKRDNYSDIYKPFILDKTFVYKIEKYDNNSSLIKLFKLNEALINYLILFRKNINNPQKLTDYRLFSKADFTNRLLDKKFLTDSMNQNFISNLNTDQIKKYQKFYDSSYQGFDGLKTYAAKQESLLNLKQKEAFFNLKNKLYTTLYNIPKDSIKFKGKDIYIKKNFPNVSSDVKGSYFVTDFKNLKDNKISFSGYYINKKGKAAGFSGCSKDLNETAFFKTKESDTSHVLNLITEPYLGGAYTVETSMGKSISNTLINYSETGKILSRKKIPFNKIPRFIKYDDINNSLIIVLNGEYLNETASNTKDEQVLYYLNLDDDSKSYVVKLPGKTYIFDIIKTEGRIFVFSNYIYFLKTDGTKSWSKAGSSDFSTNLMLTVISSEGIIQKQIPYENENAFFGVKALKLNSNTINILGYKSAFVNKDYNKLIDKELYYLLIDSKGKEIYSSWHD